MWRDVDPAHRRVIVRAGSMLTVLLVAIVLWFNRHWWEPKPPPPDYSEYFSVQEPRELLMEQFRSYDNAEIVGKQLREAGYRWRVNRLHVQCADECPPYKVDTLVIADFKHLNVSGTLTLELFNDRLFNAVFNPDDAETYLKRLEWSGVKLDKVKVSRWERQTNQLLIASNIIYAASPMGQTLGTQAYVSWEDVRLQAQSQAWYEQYGNKTVLTPIKSSDPDTAS